MRGVELRRAYRVQESLVRYWAEQAVALCTDIEDEELDEYIAPVNAAIRALQNERRIIVIGTAQSGKSTILAGIADVPVIARCPMTDSYLCWRGGHRDGGDDSHARFLPLPWLNGLELVDTAACDGPAREHCEILLQEADAVVAVVDARAPETSPVWEMLAALPEHTLSGCILAITHTDELEGEGAVTLKSTLQRLVAGLKVSPPTYVVHPGNTAGIESLRARLGEVMREPRPLRAAIHGLAVCAIDLVEKQSRILRARYSASLTDRSFISNIDSQIDHFLSKQINEIGTLQESLNKAVTDVLTPVLRSIRFAMGWVLSPTVLLRLELMGVYTDSELYAHIVDRVKSTQEKLDHVFTQTCAGHWRMIKPSMKKTLNFEIGEFPNVDLEEELAELRERLCQDLYEPFASTKLRHSFFRLFVAQAGWMRMCIIFMCFFLTTAGVLGFIGQDMLGIWCVAIALLIWLSGSLAHHRAYRHIAKEVSALTNALRLDMEQAMRPVLERLIVSRVTAYRQLYLKPRQKVARRDDMLKPLQERQKNLLIQLRTLTQRI